MKVVISALGLFLAAVPVALGGEREAEFERLAREYDAAAKEFRKIPSTNSSTTEEKIHRYEVWPGLQYIPRFVALAEARPDDDVAFRACLWCLPRLRGTGNQDRRIFPSVSRSGTARLRCQRYVPSCARRNRASIVKLSPERTPSQRLLDALSRSSGCMAVIHASGFDWT